MARSSWRYEYADHNKSFLIKENETLFTAFWAIRAPKGDVEARYIAPDNADLIKAMYGYPSADYPDLYDLLEFNKKYGTYVSAHPGVSKDVPNYYGGTYLTTKGILKMYCNTSKNSPNYQVSIKPVKFAEWKEKEGEGASLVPAHASYVSEIKQKLLEDVNVGFNTALNFGDAQATVTITGIPESIIPKIDAFVFDYWGSAVTGYQYVLKEVTEGKGVLLPSPKETTDEDARLIACGYYEKQDDDTYTFVFGGNNALNLDYRWNTAQDEKTYGIPFLDYRKYKGLTSYDYKALGVTGVDNGNASKILNALLTGGVVTVGTKVLDYEKPIADRFRFLYNVEDITLSYTNQSSPTAVPTTIKYSNVHYDKYLFDQYVPFTNNKPVLDEETTTSSPATSSPATDETEGGESSATAAPATPTGPAIKGLFAVIDGASVELYYGDKDENGKWVYENVTADYETQKIALGNAKELKEDPNFDAKAFKHNIYYVVEGSLELMTEDGTYPLELNPEFNSYSIEGVEYDEDGLEQSTSVLSGSLDPKAETPNGQDYFFEDTFVPDQASIITQRVVRTFDEFLDKKGFYTGYRIDGEEEMTVTGQRSLDHTIAKIKAEHAKRPNDPYNQIGDTSPKLVKEVAAGIKQSLIEAQKGKYEECFFFVDPTGIDSVKEYYSMIRTNHTMGEILSVKLINDSLASKISKVTVSGRVRGGIQICQEFLFKDANKTKYYSSVIGAYAAMVMKTIETTRGGRQPCWINEKDVGGQLDGYLTRTPISMRWDFTDVPNPQTGAKADTEILDLKGINPVILDPVDGVMVTSGVTTELNAGDWSRVAHTVAFDCCKREIRDNVMKPQVEKPIDEYYMDLRKQDTEKILRLRTDTYKIWKYAACKVHEVNTEYTMAQEIFNIDVEVRVKTTSRKVKLSFTNLGQITLVKD